MTGRVALAAIAFLTVGLAWGSGFWVGRQGSQRDLATTQELRRQGTQLAALLERVSDLAQRLPESDSRCARVEGSGSTALQQASLVEALHTALDRQAREAKAEQEKQSQPSNENVQAFAQGEQLLENAEKAQRWTEAEATSLRNLMGHMTGEQASSLMQRLAVAVNERKVVVQTPGPAF